MENPFHRRRKSAAKTKSWVIKSADDGSFEIYHPEDHTHPKWSDQQRPNTRELGILKAMRISR